MRQAVAARRLKTAQKMFVEEMPERPVPDVVQERRDAQQRLDATRRRNRTVAVGQLRIFLKNAVKTLAQRLPNAPGRPRRPQDVLETRMLRRRINEPSGLKLVNLAQSLRPRRVDEVAFATRFPRREVSARRRKGDVSVYRVLNERFRLVFVLKHSVWRRKTDVNLHKISKTRRICRKNGKKLKKLVF